MDHLSSPVSPQTDSTRSGACLGSGEENTLDGTTPPPLSTQARETTDARQRKVTQIRRACDEKDITALVSLAASRDGFVDDEVRRVAWPILLGCDESVTQDDTEDWKKLEAHRDEGQVQLDVDRSFIYYPNNESEKQLSSRKQELSSLIVETLRRHPALCYFQGYHDIVQVLLLVLGRQHSNEANVRLSLLRIRDFMLPTMSPAVVHLQILPSILYVANRGLYRRIAPTQPFFALGATLTLYAHDIQVYGDIARLFDFLLAGEAVLPIYFYAAITLDREKELLEVPEDEPEMLHFLLSKLPQPLDIERYIEATRNLLANYPPESLPTWKRVSPVSTLKTTRDPVALAGQSVEYGERLFQQQATSLRRKLAVDKFFKTTRLKLLTHRRPALLAAAVAVGALAWWLGNRPHLRHYLW